jgi:3-keto-5-aminohexanoate cleavage enzyme
LFRRFYMDKLIITCCVHDERPWNWPPEAVVNMPKTIKEVAQSIKDACDAGAAIAHCHVPQTTGGAQGSPFIKENYLELLHLIRQTKIIYEYRGPGPYNCQFRGRMGQGRDRNEKMRVFAPGEWEAKLAEWRAIDLGEDKPDLVNCIIGPQHLDFGEDQHHVMPTLSELEDHMKFMNEKNVKPEFEIWGADCLWNLHHLIKKNLVKKPYWLEIFMGARGSTSPPANIEELQYILKKLPDGCKWELCGYEEPRGTLSPQDWRLYLTQGMTLGGGVRVGMEGYPRFWDGTPAKSNAQIVESIVKIARDIGREVASPDEAREMLGIPKRYKTK